MVNNDNLHVFVLLNQSGITTVARWRNRCKVKKEKQTEKVKKWFYATIYGGSWETFTLQPSQHICKVFTIVQVLPSIHLYPGTNRSELSETTEHKKTPSLIS